jgi:hypothetical protein
MSKTNLIRIINFPKIEDYRGNLSFIEEGSHIPFEIKRVYWIYDVPGGEFRGSHAMKKAEEMIIALSGSFDVVLTDGIYEHRFTLNRSYYGIYLPNMIWRKLENFSTNSLAMVVASTDYSSDDYIRDYNEFLKIVKKK